MYMFKIYYVRNYVLQHAQVEIRIDFFCKKSFPILFML